MTISPRETTRPDALRETHPEKMMLFSDIRAKGFLGAQACRGSSELCLGRKHPLPMAGGGDALVCPKSASGWSRFKRVPATLAPTQSEMLVWRPPALKEGRGRGASRGSVPCRRPRVHSRRFLPTGRHGRMEYFFKAQTIFKRLKCRVCLSQLAVNLAALRAENLLPAKGKTRRCCGGRSGRPL